MVPSLDCSSTRYATEAKHTSYSLVAWSLFRENESQQNPVLQFAGVDGGAGEYRRTQDQGDDESEKAAHSSDCQTGVRIQTVSGPKSSSVKYCHQTCISFHARWSSTNDPRPTTCIHCSLPECDNKHFKPKDTHEKTDKGGQKGKKDVYLM